MENSKTNLRYLSPKCETFEFEQERSILQDSDDYYYEGAPDD